MIGPTGWEVFDDRQTDDRQTERHKIRNPLCPMIPSPASQA